MENAIDYFEIETKYKSDNINLTDFKTLMESLNPEKLIEVSSYDHYYTNESNEFIRFRKRDNKGELTIKRKLNANNNVHRVEVNLPTNTSDEKLVNSFCDLLGYKHNFDIFKNCWIYYFDKVDIVFYIVFDTNMKELNRFIEIEILEDKQLTVEESLAILKDYESKLSVLGITSKNRLKKSLFELYNKEQSK